METRPTSNLSPRQQQVIDFLRRSLRERGYVPSIRELGEALGLRSTSTIHYHLTILADRGLIRWEKGKNRSLQLLCEDPLGRTGSAILPLAGRIAAGVPIEAIEGIEVVDLATVWPTDNSYLLEVKGTSMIEDHIAPGDWVVVHKQDTARDGDIVVALLASGEATLKRFYRNKEGICLKPANAELKPLYVDHVKIQGRVVGVIRKLA
ncbi:MAG: transcriptional repressor LexA [Cyanobacteria bacterium NC_groundwater_1444_Ag_S-0.65um_54_12]|nr:transcriptional repressor LexA [Cyanobacteria bacterium NC_groundwater_1444_Ag_S-0.65um_54_12]